MDISQISQSLQRDAVWVVFLNVLLQQAGLPVPAVPTLLLAGSLTALPGQLGKVLAEGVLASVLADLLWYALGRRFGYRVLAELCRLSINPASCVSQTEAHGVFDHPAALTALLAWVGMTESDASRFRRPPRSRSGSSGRCG